MSLSVETWHMMENEEEVCVLRQQERLGTGKEQLHVANFIN